MWPTIRRRIPRWFQIWITLYVYLKYFKRYRHFTVTFYQFWATAQILFVILLYIPRNIWYQDIKLCILKAAWNSAWNGGSYNHIWETLKFSNINCELGYFENSRFPSRVCRVFLKNVVSGPNSRHFIREPCDHAKTTHPYTIVVTPSKRVQKQASLAVPPKVMAVDKDVIVVSDSSSSSVCTCLPDQNCREDTPEPSTANHDS